MMNQAYYDVDSERLKQLNERTQEQMQQQAGKCAHLIVGWVRQHIGPGGQERGWWQCTACDEKFIPMKPTSALK